MHDDIHQRIIDSLADIARRSDDPDTQVAAVLVSRAGVRLESANQLPTGVARTTTRVTRPDKYAWIMHAEQRVLCDATRLGVKTHGATMYLNWFPCGPCARFMAHSGVARLFASKSAYEARAADPRYGFASSMETLKEAEVLLEWF